MMTFGEKLGLIMFLIGSIYTLHPSYEELQVVINGFRIIGIFLFLFLGRDK